MIRKVRLYYFKLFHEQTFHLTDTIILAGPNNSGKTTLLQAIATWNLALQKWVEKRKSGSGSKAKKRTGVAVTRKDFTAIPVREMNFLWFDRSTALSRGELRPDQKLGHPRLLEIEVCGDGASGPWSLTFEFRYGNPETVYVKPSSYEAIEEALKRKDDVQVVHVPPFSGIGAEETRYDRAYQDLLIGQGKPGDILRNLLFQVSEDKQLWKELCTNIERIFKYKLLSPVYEGGPFIVCEYQAQVPKSKGEMSSVKLDIASAGSGFLQVLMLLGFIYARPASVLLLDEPDAHLHVILQKEVYDLLRDLASERGCQLMIATHSEVLVDGTSPDRIMSFFREPHILSEKWERNQTRQALRNLTTSDCLLVEDSRAILYLEDESDLNLLRKWAEILDHPALSFLRDNLFWHPIRSRNVRTAKEHFFALQALQLDVRGVLLLDGDNRGLDDHEVIADGLSVIRWPRYEAESYLLHPAALERFIQSSDPNLFSAASAKEGLAFLEKELPPAVLIEPLEHHPILESLAVSKALLPQFFEAAGIEISKSEYYRVAMQMTADEISPDVTHTLDQIVSKLELE